MKPPGAVRLHPVPVSLRAANAWVLEHHRHNKPVRGSKFQVAACDDEGTVHGIAICGRPVARMSDDGLTCEVYRSVTLDGGPPGVNSFLYARCWRIAREMGYLRLITMTQGASRAPPWSRPGTASSASARLAGPGRSPPPTSG